jgi:cerevisin
MKVALSAQFLALLSTISVTIATPVFDATVIDKDAAPLLSSTSSAEHEIPNNYIVVFKKDVDSNKATDHHNWVTSMHRSTVGELRKRSQVPLASSSGWFDDIEAMAGLKHTYDIGGIMKGYSGAFDATVLSHIRKHPDVSVSSLSSPFTLLFHSSHNHVIILALTLL